MTTPKEMIDTLNKEYIWIGKITINNITEEVIEINKINYIKDIMKDITSINVSIPIVLGKNYNNYTLLDWYHRLKYYIDNNISDINAIVLDWYKIDRSYDSFYDFINNNIGNKIKFINDNLIIINNSKYYIEFNEWCWWCWNWWSEITVNKSIIWNTINIETISKDNIAEDRYNLIINNLEVANIDTWWGNWYYGWDFNIVPVL